MSENLRKLIGVAVMAAIVVVGVVVTNDDDSDFTRNAMLFQGVNQAGDNGEIEALEMRLMRIEKLLGQIPELAILAEVIDRAEAGSARVDRSVAGAVENVGNAEEEALRRIAEAIDWVELDLVFPEQRESSRAYFAALRDAASTIDNETQGFRSSLTALSAELSAWVENANAQMTGVAPQFGPEFPGIGPMVEILCRTQLASWGVTANGVSAGWDIYEEFWACAYDRLQLEELRGRERGMDSVAFCLPGQEFSRRGNNNQQPSLFESIGRRGTTYWGWEDTLRFDGVCS